MSGLNLGFGGGVRLGNTLSNSPPATLAQTAYGGGAAATTGGGVQEWYFAVGVGAAGLAWLMFLRWTLPS